MLLSMPSHTVVWLCACSVSLFCRSRFVKVVLSARHCPPDRTSRLGQHLKGTQLVDTSINTIYHGLINIEEPSSTKMQKNVQRSRSLLEQGVGNPIQRCANTDKFLRLRDGRQEIS